MTAWAAYIEELASFRPTLGTAIRDHTLAVRRWDDGQRYELVLDSPPEMLFAGDDCSQVVSILLHCLQRIHPQCRTVELVEV